MKNKICLSIGANNIREIRSIIEKTKELIDIYEIRLDYLKNTKEILDYRIPCKTIYTFRTKSQGGLYEGNEEERINLLLEIVKTYPSSFIDLEFNLNKDVFYNFNKYAETICSIHKFHDEISDEDFDELFRKPAEVYKVAFLPNSIRDIFKALQKVSKYKTNKKILFIAMGNLGIWTRILSIFLDNPWTYIAYTYGKETAEGQISLNQAFTLYRLKEIDTSYKVYGIIGKPLEHSFSPIIHNFSFKYLNYKGIYVPFEIDNLEKFLSEIRKYIPLEGLSVTLPYKKEALEYIDYLDEDVAQIGSLNTIKWENEKWCGYNTDYKAFMNSLVKAINPEKARVLILGAGGVANSVIYALKKFNADIAISSRNNEKAFDLANLFDIKAIKWEEKQFYEYDILINATPVGMYPDTTSKPIEIKEGEGKVIFDLIYNPMKTALLEEAEEKGAKIINGLDMFIEQAIEQLNIWIGKSPPKEMLLEVAKNIYDEAY